MDVGGRSGDTAVFATVAEQGSLSAAAHALGLTLSAVSRIIAYIGEFSVAEDLQRGELVPLLQAFNPGDRVPVHAVFADGLVVVLARQDESAHRTCGSIRPEPMYGQHYRGYQKIEKINPTETAARSFSRNIAASTTKTLIRNGCRSG